jgi:mRNA interferase YafQ
MRRIERTGQFKRDYKREAKGPHRATLERDFIEVVTALANDQPLAEKHRDHALSGDWKDHRDCHLKPDGSSPSKRWLFSIFSISEGTAKINRL